MICHPMIPVCVVLQALVCDVCVVGVVFVVVVIGSCVVIVVGDLLHLARMIKIDESMLIDMFMN